MPERGVLRNPDFARQVPRFDGMRWGSISPTDIDLFLDFGNHLFVFAEAKFGDATLGVGQRLALERLCDACHNPPHRSSVAFIVSHWNSGDIDLAAATVSGFRWQGKWHTPKRLGQTLKAGIDSFKSIHAANEIDPWLAEYEAEEARVWQPKTAQGLWG